ncbi:MAG: hypothetical protein DRJ15_13255, partial [Bacteroidetes bacterium]
PQFQGHFYKVSLKNFDVPTDSLSWTIDSGSVTYEPSNEYPNDRAKDITYINVNTDDWERC